MRRLNRQLGLAVCALVMAPAAGICCSSDVTCPPGQMCVHGDCRPYEAPRVVCGIAKMPSSTSIVLGLAESRASGIVQDIAEAAGLENVPTVYSGNVANAVAFMRYDERLIVYNSEFMDEIADIGGTSWEANFILAHEFCHHAEGHIFSGSGCNPEQELQADACAARALKRQGATLDQTTSAMRVMDDPSGPCHPSSTERVARITRSYLSYRVALRAPLEPRPQGPFNFQDNSRDGYEKAKRRFAALRLGMTFRETLAVLVDRPDDPTRPLPREMEFVDGLLCLASAWGRAHSFLFGYTENGVTEVKVALVLDALGPRDPYVLTRVQEDPPYRCEDERSEQGSLGGKE